MVQIEFCEKNTEERKKIVKTFRLKNLSGRHKGRINKIEIWCEKYLSDIDGDSFDFNSVIEALPEELLKIKDYLDRNYDVPQIMKELPYGDKYCYIETSLYTNMKDDAKELLVQKLNVIVCPYCNRNYVFSDKEIITCELDHFIPKRKYPIFASSFYNLIPVCPYCNRKKGESEFKIYPHSSERSTADLLKFSYKVLGSNYLTDLDDLDVELKVLDNNYLIQANILNLEALYKHHKDVVQDVLKKRQIFSDIYIESLSKEFSTLFKTPMDVEELIYGISLKKGEYGKRPLTKLIQDIINEVVGE